METARKNISTNADGSLPANYRLGEYRIKSVLGIGGFGITYLARDTKLGALVAIKEYFPQSMAFRNDRFTIIPRGRGNATVAQNYQWGLKEFLKEARVLAKFKHNNIVRVLRFIEGNGSAYMVMEYEEGQSLAEFIKKRGGFLNEKDLLNVFLPILSGLQAVHKAGILHLDIKPDNIYLRSDGLPMLIDFGSAGQVAKEADDKKAIALTPAYSAVENYPDMGEQGPWSDIYSIGATLYRCITGKHPANAIDRHHAKSENTDDPLVAARSIERPRYSDYIRESIDWALEVDQQDRPQNALALQQGIMGRGRFKEAVGEKSFNKFRSGFIGVVRVREEKESTGRSFFEYSLFAILVSFIVGFYLLSTGAIDKNYLLSTANDIEQYFTTSDKNKGINNIKNKAVLVYDTARHKVLGTKPDIIPKQATTNQAIKDLSNNLSKKPVPVFNPELKLVKKIKNRYGNIRFLKFANNNTLLISSSDSGYVRIFDLVSDKLIKTFSISRIGAPEIAVSSDGSLIAIADKATTLIIDPEKFETIAMLAGHTAMINKISFSPNNKIIATSSKDQKIILWDIYKQKIIKKVGYKNAAVSSLDFSPNGKILASADESGGIRYWEAGTGKILASFAAQNGKVNSISYSGDGKWLAVAGENKFLKLLSIGLTVKDQVPESIPANIRKVTVTPDSKWLLAAGSSENIYMWDLVNNKRFSDLTGHKGEIFSLALSADNKWVAAAGLSSEISIWQPKIPDKITIDQNSVENPVKIPTR